MVATVLSVPSVVCAMKWGVSCIRDQNEVNLAIPVSRFPPANNANWGYIWGYICNSMSAISNIINAFQSQYESYSLITTQIMRCNAPICTITMSAR